MENAPILVHNQNSDLLSATHRSSTFYQLYFLVPVQPITASIGISKEQLPMSSCMQQKRLAYIGNPTAMVSHSRTVNPSLILLKFENEFDLFFANMQNGHDSNLKVAQLNICQFVKICIVTVYLAMDGAQSKKMWNIFKFGSTVWEIETNDSDIDMAIDMKQSNVSRSAKQKVLKAIMERIRNETQLLLITDITNARYPIIRIKDRCYGIQIDLSVADKYCLKTTQYVQSTIDTIEGFGIPIRKFIIFIKHWSKRCGINNALKCYLNSFGYTLMAIHYVQSLVLGCRLIEKKVSCLVIGFFSFYGFRFNHRLHRIDITNGTGLPSKRRPVI